MNLMSQKKTAEQMVEAIFALDLEQIKSKLMNKKEGHGWTRDQADRYELEYKRFLALLAKFPDESIAPNVNVDKFWHGHILDTMKYAKDCDDIFGYFLHHYPYFGLRGEQDAADQAAAAVNMQRLYQQEFGAEAKPGDIAYCGRAADKTVEAGDQSAAYCGRASVSYCGRAADKHDAAAAKDAAPDAAYCGRASVSYCGAAIDKAEAASAQDTAYCGAAVKAAANTGHDVAYCGRASVSYCGAAIDKTETASGQDAAYCGAAVQAQADPDKEVAYCGRASVSYCGAAAVADKVTAMPESTVAYCGAASPGK